MEQIYYTQCPIGYGLGASNGYQIKRISADYPVTGDFRHLGLKAFPGGGRTLAPTVLRYRREAEFAEVTCLTPRPQEYHTERGYWGRPGGVFAHGVRLTAAELGLLGNWPAGLFDNPAWQTADKEPTRGRPPAELDLTGMKSFRPAAFAALAGLSVGEDPGWLARVWTALAQVTREGRTLFLIDEPDRLARSVAFLTLGFPLALRSDLTFSTFHDRPEELPGYRVQGTSPVVRPNRLSLLSQGVIADCLTGTIEPNVQPAEWATILAGWCTRREPIDEADWSASEARAQSARKPGDPIDMIWSDAWLDPLIGFPQAYRERSTPETAAGWNRLGQFARWAGRSGIGDDWLRHRGPAWWLENARQADPTSLPEARAALVTHARLREAWRTHEQARRWGEAIAHWFGTAGTERDEAVVTLFAAAPRAARPSFAQSLFRGLDPVKGAATLARLRNEATTDRATLLPLEAGILAGCLVQAAAAAEANDPFRVEVAAAIAALHRVLAESASLPGATTAALDAVAAVATDHPATIDLLASAITPAFNLDAADGGREAIAWALRQEATAAAWLAPALRPRLADPGRGDLFATLRDRVPADLWPRLARAVVTIAADPGLPDDAIRLAIERLVLTLAPRPHDPSWAETYLRRTPSTWDLFRRLYSKELIALGLPAWVDLCRGRGEISPEQVGRVETIRLFARSLSSGDPQSLVETPIPTGVIADRAPFFRQMLGRLGGDHLEGLSIVLDACRAAWPGAFEPATPGLPSLAKALAERLMPSLQPRAEWLQRVCQVLDRLHLTKDGGGFEPDGLMAEVVAALPHSVEVDPWRLRQFLFEEDRAWPTLSALIRADLAQVGAADAPALVERWDNKVIKSAKPKVLPARFWELILNSASPDQLATIVPARVKDLQSLGPLPWWDHARHAESVGDLRDAYARLIPLSPLPTGRLAEVERWLKTKTVRFDPIDEPISMEDPIPEDTRLSSFGADRWYCLKLLTEYGPGLTAPRLSREASLQAWQALLPMRCLTPDEVYRWMGWTILGIDPTDPPTLDKVAAWFFEVGVVDAKRVSRWVDELPLPIPAQTQMDRASFVGTLGRTIRTMTEQARERFRMGNR